MTALAVIFDIRWMVWGASPFGAMALWAALSPTKGRGRLAVFLLVGSVMLGGLYWVSLKIPPSELVLTEEDKATFTRALSSALAKPEFTIVSCPAADERTCMYATQFIPLFQRAGWKVQGPSVERSQMGRPTSDVIIVNKGPALVDPQDPDHGVWTQVSPWTQPIRTALMMVGILPITMNDTELPPEKVRVYFGSIPKKK